MNEDEKHDKIPEMWQGHNIADYIDPDIMTVSLCARIIVLICPHSVTRVSFSPLSGWFGNLLGGFLNSVGRWGLG